jgi:hypothetical protein
MLLALAAVATAAPPALAADKQIRPFIGSAFGGATTYVDPDNVVGRPNLAWGVSVVTLGEVLGFDIDFADAPGFFEGDQHLVLSGHVTTLTGNVVVAAPRRLTEYLLRPYAVGGFGLMRIHRDDYFSVFTVNRVAPSFDVGGGILMFLTNRVGTSLEMRRFQTFDRQSDDPGLTVTGGVERTSFWRVSVSLAIRY